MNYFSTSTESSRGYTSWHKDVILQALYSTLQQSTKQQAYDGHTFCSIFVL